MIHDDASQVHEQAHDWRPVLDDAAGATPPATGEGVAEGAHERGDVVGAGSVEQVHARGVGATREVSKAEGGGAPVKASVLLVAAAIVDVQAKATGRAHWRSVADELTAYAALLAPAETGAPASGGAP